jgi:hypothetical protein
VITTLALAFHPGHGTTEPSGLLHYLTEPVHVVALATVVTVVAVIANLAWRSVAHSARSRR